MGIFGITPLANLISRQRITRFQKMVWGFYAKHRRSFPWRLTKNPYHILVSEVMLQQTQAPRVVLFYQNWIKRFPNVKTLARAKFSQIYPFWKGLGYNRRALALQKLAKAVIKSHNGKIPLGVADLEALPGVGPYTARAVAIFAGNAPIACIETNIRRVFIHHFFTGKTNISDVDIMVVAQQALPRDKSREWHWALMDYGSYLKSHVVNPNRRHRQYAVQPVFEGSVRQVRGAILRTLGAGSMDVRQLSEAIGKKPGALKKILAALEKEEFIGYKNSRYVLR